MELGSGRYTGAFVADRVQAKGHSWFRLASGF
jgi:hypothetical protein